MIRKIIIGAKAQDTTSIPVKNEKRVVCMGTEVRQLYKNIHNKNSEATGLATRN